ncbi:MAG: HypC/HybG/HupF family hydrogenase formation chaperone [Helicobacter sp.]|nr:HypC/HybG/HupF family hydrogenase formation chaperone [Helicobacter sp.]MDE5816291.1 HypC/HybG/HupF family hydrogenase formation chaperone [Helicobacter sp.]MDE6044573.1 HypC/HybG/HupF family hydrogenase formation chaperone [Helicobacter sp.]MDE7196932.1 HypC/HybG/HupF family hydrogenase formation chaperone [Helicobacter sp.]
MCLAIPSKVVAIDKETNTATLETLGVTRVASLDLMQEPVSVGEFVLLHVGFVMSKIDTESAELSLSAYQEMIAAMESEERESRGMD